MQGLKESGLPFRALVVPLYQGSCLPTVRSWHGDAEAFFDLAFEVNAPSPHNAVHRGVGAVALPGLPCVPGSKGRTTHKNGGPTDLAAFSVVTRGCAWSGLNSVHRTECPAPPTSIPQALAIHSATFCRQLPVIRHCYLQLPVAAPSVRAPLATA